MKKAMQLKARIKKLADKNNIPAQAVLQNLMLERLLERISRSNYQDKLILKGGMLIASLVGIQSRTTMDMDTTLKGYPLSEDSIRQILEKICAIDLDDETIFVLKEIKSIRDADEYGGYRVSIIAQYESIKTPLKIDITTGDQITPDAIQYTFPSNFEEKMIGIWAYNIETILAEKVETILRRGIFNTRSRDFYDIYILTKTQGFDKTLFSTALKATAQKRMSLAALEDREQIINNIQSDKPIKKRWERYCKENYYAKGILFNEVLSVLREIIPVYDNRP